MVPDLQLKLSISRCQVLDYTTSRVLRVINVCVSVEFLHARFNAAQGTHLFPVVRVTSNRVSQRLHDDFQLSPASIPVFDRTDGVFQHLHAVASLSSISRALEDAHRRRAVRSAAVASTLGNGLGMPALLGHSLEMELLLQCKPLVLHFFELCPQGQSDPWSSWSFRMSSTEISARECNILSCESAASCAHSPLPRSDTSGPAAVIKTAWRFRASRLKASSCHSAWAQAAETQQIRIFQPLEFLSSISSVAIGLVLTAAILRSLSRTLLWLSVRRFQHMR